MTIDDFEKLQKANAERIERAQRELINRKLLTKHNPLINQRSKS